MRGWGILCVLQGCNNSSYGICIVRVHVKTPASNSINWNNNCSRNGKCLLQKAIVFALTIWQVSLITRYICINIILLYFPRNWLSTQSVFLGRTRNFQSNNQFQKISPLAKFTLNSKFRLSNKHITILIYHLSYLDKV